MRHKGKKQICEGGFLLTCCMKKKIPFFDLTGHTAAVGGGSVAGTTVVVSDDEGGLFPIFRLLF